MNKFKDLRFKSEIILSLYLHQQLEDKISEILEKLREENQRPDISFTAALKKLKFLFGKFLSEFRDNTEQEFNIDYKQIEEGDFVDVVVNALASGEGPDIIILSADNILRFEDKIFPIPYEFVSERDFRDAFIEGSEIFLSSQGVLGLPFSVDPLITYWNRDILQSSGVSSPPKFWSEFFPFVDRIAERDNALNITRAAVALGGYSNVKNAKEIILSMMFQNDNSVISRNERDDSPKVLLAQSFGEAVSPAESVIRFYTEFSNPAKTSYSWNQSLPNSIEAFSSGDLSLYFGFASELEEIRDKNPNLNFDISLFPQPTEDINKKIAKEFFLSKSEVVSQLHAMKSAGLIDYIPKKTAMKVNLVTLTDKGKEILDRILSNKNKKNTVVV